MKVGDVVRNKNAHPSFNNSRGVFLGMRTFGEGELENPYTCAMVAWFGGRISPIQTNLIEVISNVE